MTQRQHAIVQMLLRGASNREIGIRLGIAPDTAANHVGAISRKFRASSRRHLADLIRTVFDNVSEADYLGLTDGLAKRWDDELFDAETKTADCAVGLGLEAEALTPQLQSDVDTQLPPGDEWTVVVEPPGDT